MGEEIQQENSVVVSVRLPRAVALAVQRVADRSTRNRSLQILHFIRAGLEKLEAEDSRGGQNVETRRQV